MAATHSELYTELSGVIRRATSSGDTSDPRWTVCLRGADAEVIMVTLATRPQARRLRAELERLGFKMVEDDPSYDYVFCYDG